MVLLVPFVRVRLKLGHREVAGGVADELLFEVEVEFHAVTCLIVEPVNYRLSEGRHET